MNEHEELFEQVDDRVHGIYLMGYNREGISDSRNRIEQIIALVRADERKRIREALLSDEATTAAVETICGLDRSEEWGYEVIRKAHWDAYQKQTAAALAAIGIAGEDQL